VGKIERIKLPESLRAALERCDRKPRGRFLWIRIARQELWHCEFRTKTTATVLKKLTASTSRFGIGQQEGSNRTPLGLHRVAKKFGDGLPAGAVFKARVYQGYEWNGQPEDTITSRILWLDGLEPGFNRGGKVDSLKRYIYLHGTGDQSTLGRPATCGCTHLADKDLLPLYEEVPVGMLVWISRR
jgi:hypothetical protein